LEKLYNSEYKIYEDEILGEIRSELAARYAGAEGRLLEHFSRDIQLKTALSILKNQGVYNRLLNVH
jgi:hypothetical protein